MTAQPFASTSYTYNVNNVSTRISASLNPAVPKGKLLIVEHISGWVAVRDGDVVDLIHADAGDQPDYQQEVYLPEHFASRPLNFGGQLGVARMHQFGSPCRLYVSAGWQIQVIADANSVGVLDATAIGYLVDA
jgi:hypothetical protein